MSYSAIIGRLINVRMFPNADRIQLSDCFGTQVVVGLDAKENDLVIYFSDDGQLSEQYTYENNLYNKGELNKDSNKTGFFSSNRRVKCQKFRGEKSEAYVASLDSVAFTGVDSSILVEGFRFNELNGIPICNKYVTEETINKAKENQSKTQKGYNKAELKKLFPEHIDTEQFRFVQDKDIRGLVYVNLKFEGTSGRSAYIKYPVKQTYKWYQKLVAAITMTNLPEYIESYQKVYGTRRVVKGLPIGDEDDYRIKVHKQIEPFMKKDEIWYYEIIGYNSNGSAIQGQVSTDKMPKEFRKRFGSIMTYSYGCPVGSCDFYVYRIAVKTEEGMYELPWSSVKDKCNNAGIKHVSEIGCMFVKNDQDAKELKETIRYLIEDDDIADPTDRTHIKEGYVIRIEPVDGKSDIKLYKEKTFEYKVLASIIKEDINYVDEEESQTDIL